MTDLSEDQEQALLIKWCKQRTYGGKFLDEIIFAIPNGGFRNAREASKLKRTGVRPGVFDLFLPIGNLPSPSQPGGYYGLFIEMKAGKGKESPAQLTFAKTVSDLGYKAVICYGWREAANAIADYLGYHWWIFPE
jgi:hypothetical protein